MEAMNEAVIETNDQFEFNHIDLEDRQFEYLSKLNLEQAVETYNKNIEQIEMIKNSISSMFSEIKRTRAENKFLKKKYDIKNKKERVVEISNIRPFESKEAFYKFVNYVKIRNYSLAIYCIIGATYGLRHSDIVKLKLKDIKEYIERRKLNKDEVYRFKDKKTRNKNFIEFDDMQIQIVEQYIKKTFDFEYDEKTPLIIDLETKKGFVYSTTLDRMKRYAKDIGLNPEFIGSHTLRKTFGYFMHLDGKSIEEIMLALNQNSQDVTLRYIGITPEQVRKNKIANLPGLADFIDD